MLPESVEISEGPDGVVLLLRRDPRVFRRFGWTLVAVAGGVVVCGALLFAFLSLFQGAGPGWSLPIVFALAALACLGVGVVFIRTGGGASTTRIGVDALSLTVFDRFAWWKRRETVSRSVIRSFIVEPLVPQPSAKGKQGEGFLAALGQIRVLLETGESKRFAYG